MLSCQPLCIQVVFQLTVSSLTSLPVERMVAVRSFPVVVVVWDSISCHSVFSLLLTMGEGHWSIIQFTDSVLNHLNSDWFHPGNSPFFFYSICSGPWFPFVSILYFFTLCWDFLRFSLVSGEFVILMMTYFKCTSDLSNNLTHLVFSIIWLLPLTQVVILLVLGMMDDF